VIALSIQAFIATFLFAAIGTVLCLRMRALREERQREFGKSIQRRYGEDR
jgi:hypothetical protein